MYKSYIGLFRFIPISHFYVIINADKKPEKLTGSVTKVLLKFGFLIFRMGSQLPKIMLF